MTAHGEQSDAVEGPAIHRHVNHVEFLGHETLVHVDAGTRAPAVDEQQPGAAKSSPRRRCSQQVMGSLSASL